MEFALFQNTICDMLENNCSKNQIIDLCGKILNIIKPVMTTLILYRVDEPAAFLSSNF